MKILWSSINLIRNGQIKFLKSLRSLLPHPTNNNKKALLKTTTKSAINQNLFLNTLYKQDIQKIPFTTKVIYTLCGLYIYTYIYIYVYINVVFISSLSLTFIKGYTYNKWVVIILCTIHFIYKNCYINQILVILKPCHS